MTEGLRIAVPNKGRLKEPSTALLHDAGLSFESTDRALSVPVQNADLELIFVRTDDIPELVTDGVADVGITGYDLLAESELGASLKVLAELDYGHCRLAAAVPAHNSDISRWEAFSGSRIATSHPRVTGSFFADKDIDVKVVEFKGSVEVATKIGVADAIVDLVSTGSTLQINGLRAVGTVLESQAVLVAGERQNGTVARLASALSAVVTARRTRYLVLNAPEERVEEIAELVPGLRSPTVMPLQESGMVAIHTTVATSKVWDLLPRLEAAGGQDILVLPVHQML